MQLLHAGHGQAKPAAPASRQDSRPGSTMLLMVVVVLSSATARANPVAYGQQLCVMLASGISQQKAWDYIVREHAKAAMANPQTVIPWYSAASAGWALGTALGNAEVAHKELAAMKPDAFKVARSTCPQQFR